MIFLLHHIEHLKTTFTSTHTHVKNNIGEVQSQMVVQKKQRTMENY